MTSFTESVVEEAALACLESPGLQVAHGPGVALDMPAAERTDCGEVIVYKAPTARCGQSIRSGFCEGQG